MPLTFTNAEDIINLIEKEFKQEITYYAAENVAVTAHDVGQTDSDNWTQALYEKKVISSLPKEKNTRYTEIERTVTAFYCASLIKIDIHGSYPALIEAQKNAADIKSQNKLTLETYIKLHTQANKIIDNKDKMDILNRLIIYSDLGKSPQFKQAIKKIADKKNIVINLSVDPDNLITEILKKFTDEELETLLPSFCKLTLTARQTFKEIYPLMQACFGHLYFLERGEETLEIIAQALSSISPEKRQEALDLVYLAQWYDGLGAQGQRNIKGSLTCTENFSQGYTFIYEALHKLNSTPTPLQGVQTTFNEYLNKRAKLLGFSIPLSIEQQFLTRMGCMLRGFTKEFGQLLITQFQKLSPSYKLLLTTQFGFTDAGIEGWTSTHYIATGPQNISRKLFENDQTEEAITQAFNFMICFAMVIATVRNNYPDEIKNKLRVISFGELAFLATKSPGLFNPATFQPEEFILNLENNKIMPKTPHLSEKLSYRTSVSVTQFSPAMNKQITSPPLISSPTKQM